MSQVYIWNIPWCSSDCLRIRCLMRSACPLERHFGLLKSLNNGNYNPLFTWLEKSTIYNRASAGKRCIHWKGWNFMLAPQLASFFSPRPHLLARLYFYHSFRYYNNGWRAREGQHFVFRTNLYSACGSFRDPYRRRTSAPTVLGMGGSFTCKWCFFSFLVI